MESEVFAQIVNAIDERRVKIDRAMGQRGGWEGWLQVELAMHLQDCFGGFYGVHREVDGVFHDNASPRKVDLFCVAVEKRYPSIGIELKCDTRTSDPFGFDGEVKKDIKKCRNGPVDQLKCSPGIIFLCVGITTQRYDMDSVIRKAEQLGEKAKWLDIGGGLLLFFWENSWGVASQDVFHSEAESSQYGNQNEDQYGDQYGTNSSGFQYEHTATSLASFGSYGGVQTSPMYPSAGMPHFQHSHPSLSSWGLSSATSFQGSQLTEPAPSFYTQSYPLNGSNKC